MGAHACHMANTHDLSYGWRPFDVQNVSLLTTYFLRGAGM
jgi:hypothetical protein